VKCRPGRLPHHLVAGARHEAETDIERRLNHDPAVDARDIRADVRETNVDAEFVPMARRLEADGPSFRPTRLTPERHA
jgi:hypothetical protein